MQVVAKAGFTVYIMLFSVILVNFNFANLNFDALVKNIYVASKLPIISFFNSNFCNIRD